MVSINKKILSIITSGLLMITAITFVFISIFFKNISSYVVPVGISMIIGLIIYPIGYLIVYLTSGITLKKIFRNKVQMKIIFKIAMISIAYVFFEGIILSRIISSLGVNFDLYNIVNILPIQGQTRFTFIIYTGIMTIMIAPICEEVLYRYLIIEELKASKIGSVGAVVISAIFFGISHLSLNQGINAIFFGALSGYIYIKYNNVKYNIALHTFINIITFIIMIMR